VRKDLLPFYRALGLNPGAGPTDIRRAYRHLVQQWHPDLFKPGSPMQTTAEDITKEINEAYSQLYRKKLYRQYPPKEEAAVDVADEPLGRPAAAPRRCRPTPRARPPAHPPAAKSGRRKRARDWMQRLWRRRAVRILLGIGALALMLRLGAVLWNELPAFSAPAEPAAASAPPKMPVPASVPAETGVAAPTPQERAPAGAALAPAPQPIAVGLAPVRRSLAFRAPLLSLRATAATTSGFEAPGVTADPDRLAGAAALLIELFESGDPKARVLAVQGPPDDAGDSVFRYGSSLVYFRDGRVRGWVDRLPRLRVRSWDDVAMPSLEHFSVGSSRSEVVRAQGRPDAFSIDRYLYGSSEVAFVQDRVAAWSTGDVPLHAFDVPALPFGELDRARGSAP